MANTTKKSPTRSEIDIAWLEEHTNCGEARFRHESRTQAGGFGYLGTTVNDVHVDVYSTRKNCEPGKRQVWFAVRRDTHLHESCRPEPMYLSRQQARALKRVLPCEEDLQGAQ